MHAYYIFYGLVLFQTTMVVSIDILGLSNYYGGFHRHFRTLECTRNLLG